MDTPAPRRWQRTSEPAATQERPYFDRAELVIYCGCGLVALLLLMVALEGQTAGRADALNLVNTLFAGLGLVAVAAAILLQHQSTLEAEFGKEYREIAGALPVRVWQKEPTVTTSESSIAEPGAKATTDGELDESAKRLAYRYFDLCNTQALARQQRRISRKTWRVWRDGIRDNLELPWFAARYIELHEARGSDSAHFAFLDQHVPAGLRAKIARAGADRNG